MQNIRITITIINHTGLGLIALSLGETTSVAILVLTTVCMALFPFVTL
jgi:hypothetical protein